MATRKSKKNQESKPDNSVKITIISTAGVIVATLISALFAPAFLKWLDKPSAPTPINQVVSVFDNSGFGKFMFGAIESNARDCVLSNSSDHIDQFQLWKQEYPTVVASYESKLRGKTLTWKVYAPDGSKFIDDTTYRLDEDLCFWLEIEMPRTAKPGNYRLLIMDGNIPLFEKEYWIEYYDLSKIVAPSRPRFGNLFTFGRKGMESISCAVKESTDTIDSTEFQEDNWLYFTSTYSSEDIGNSYIYQVISPENVIAQEHEYKLEDNDYYFCAWNGFSLGNSPVVGRYILRVNYLGQTIYEKEFWIR